MAIVQRLMASGLPPLTANNIVGDTSGALTAAGTTKATALQLSAAQSYISICSSGKGAALPQVNQGDSVEVFNGGANSLLVYTPVGISDTITNQSANGGFTIATMRGARFNKVSSSLWMVNYSA